MGISDSEVLKKVIWHTVNITVIFLPVLLLAIVFGTSDGGSDFLRQGLILVFVMFVAIDWIWFSQIRWRLKAKLGYNRPVNEDQKS
ncbi:MAG: hypothetical protein QQN63_02335 [Nitrosopumilus sp.]